MNKLLLNITILLFSFLLPMQVWAQSFSYVYIQGDKETPIYVKMEDQMQPRYGQNYCVISQLAPGPINIEVLFQQNKYPAQHFTIVVPENGSRGFLVTQRDNEFFLYDLQRNYYLPAGNIAADDHPPVRDIEAQYVSTKDLDTAETAVPQPVIKKAQKSRPKPVKPAKKVDVVVPQSDEPPFIENIELDKKREVKETPKQAEPAKKIAPVTSDTVAVSPNAEEEKTTVAEAAPDTISITLPSKKERHRGRAKETEVPPTDADKTAAAVLNSDCPAPISDSAFDAIHKRLMEKKENNKWRYLHSISNNCYTTAQVRFLATEIEDDDDRMDFLKKIYSRVTDQSEFHTLEDLFLQDREKEKFKEIAH